MKLNGHKLNTVGDCPLPGLKQKPGHWRRDARPLAVRVRAPEIS